MICKNRLNYNHFKPDNKILDVLCINKNLTPFFTDSTNIMECERQRLDLVNNFTEEILNEFFGVKSIREFEPKKYKYSNYTF